MNEIQSSLKDVLNRATDRLREASLPNALVQGMERLAGQVEERCTVAVVGQVKAGKSTFVNALLGGNLAKVGTTETTATINYFSFGKPLDPLRPVKCHWRGGKTTWEDRAFLDGLQGNDIETLRRADGIDRLEYFLEHDFLDEVTLVDTPGTNAVVEEHQDRTAEYMQLHDELRDRHNEETEQLGRDADAVIYITGAVARETEQKFLEEFAKTTGGRSSALNAVGVMSKIELHHDVLVERHALSQDIERQMRDQLNAVIPVGAGVHRALEVLLAGDRAGLRRLVDVLGRIPPKSLRSMLKMDTRFLGEDYDDCPVSVEERQALFEELPEDVRVWPIFATMVRAAADPEPGFDVDAVEKKLKEISNFDTLMELLHKHFIERGHILRCFRIVGDARRLIARIKHDHLPERRGGMGKESDRLGRFLDLIRQSGGDLATIRDLEDFVLDHLDVNRGVKELEDLHEELAGEIDGLYHELEQYNADFEALQTLERSEHGFTEAELNELRPLLGLYSLDTEKRLPPGKANLDYANERQLYWSGKMRLAPFGSARLAVAERAFTRYGIIYAELDKRASAPAGAKAQAYGS